MNYNIANKTFDGIPKLAFIGGQRWETVEAGSFETSEEAMEDLDQVEISKVLGSKIKNIGPVGFGGFSGSSSASEIHESFQSDDEELIDLMVKKHGEKCRKLAIGAIEWLNENENKWKLRHPVGRKGFLNKLISKAIFHE